MIYRPKPVTFYDVTGRKHPDEIIAEEMAAELERIARIEGAR